MKTWVLASSIIILLIIFHPIITYAHTLEIDNEVGAVLHINPEDDPYVGENAEFYFEFKDKEGTFKIGDCRCLFSILQNGQTLFSTNLDNPSVNYTFPAKGAYTARIDGQPAVDADFKPFTFNWDLQITRERAKKEVVSSTTNPSGIGGLHLIHYIGIGIITSFLFIFLFIDHSRRKKTKEIPLKNLSK